VDIVDIDIEDIDAVDNVVAVIPSMISSLNLWSPSSVLAIHCGSITILLCGHESVVDEIKSTYLLNKTIAKLLVKINSFHSEIYCSPYKEITQLFASTKHGHLHLIVILVLNVAVVFSHFCCKKNFISFLVVIAFSICWSLQEYGLLNSTKQCGGASLES